MNNFPIPTDEQNARAERVQKAICNELNLAAREGVSPPEMLAGLAAATADLITTTAGPAFVRRWFERQAQVAAELERGH